MRQNTGKGVLTKNKARKAAKLLVKRAQELGTSTMKGTITFTKNSVDVSVSALQSEVSSKVQSEIQN